MPSATVNACLQGGGFQVNSSSEAFSPESDVYGILTWNIILRYGSGSLEIHSVGFELAEISPPQPFKCWDYWCAFPVCQLDTN